MKFSNNFKLANGVEVPIIGLGTWQATHGKEAENAVKTALKVGYRHIDTAAAYENEESIGRAIEESGIKRENLFVTTKLWNNTRGYDHTLKAIESSLENLGLSYIDLYLIHWPNPLKFRTTWEQANAESWRAMEDLYNKGKIRAIGVSNFRPKHLKSLFKTAKIAPMVNQIRLCPGDVNTETVEFCEEKNILLQGYSPFGTGKIFDIPELIKVAERYDKTVAQICIRWSLQMGFNPLPKSTTPERISENIDVFDFEITEKDIGYINSLTGCCGTSADPDNVPF